MEEPTTSKDDFSRFQVFFYRKTGIQFEESKRYFVDKRLIERIGETGSKIFRSYIFIKEHNRKTYILKS